MYVVLLGSTADAGGTWVDETFVPPSLGFENPLWTYLPEGYSPSGGIDYQVTIWLHGWGAHSWSDTTLIAAIRDSLVSAGEIDPCIFACPEGWCPPYNGSMWANSILYGNYEDYVIQDIIDFVDQHYCTLGGAARYVMGLSMGGSGALDLAFRHPDLFQCVCTSSAVPDMVIDMPYVIEEVISECPEPEPPYTYDWGNGFYTNAEFMYAGAYSPNLSAPDSVDFPLDSNGELVESVYALWELHNPAHMVKLDPPSGLMIGLTWGLNDGQAGLVECNYTFADTLASLALPYAVYTDDAGHAIPHKRMANMLLIAMGDTGIEGGLVSPPLAALRPPCPSPFSCTTTVAFELPQAGSARLDVFDLSGRLMETLVEGELAAGEHSVVFDGSGLASGVYLVRLASLDAVLTSRCVRLR